MTNNKKLHNNNKKGKSKNNNSWYKSNIKLKPFNRNNLNNKKVSNNPNKNNNKQFKKVHDNLNKKYNNPNKNPNKNKHPNRNKKKYFSKNKKKYFGKKKRRNRDKFRFRNRRPVYKHKYLKRKVKRGIKKYWNRDLKCHRQKFMKKNEYYWKKIKQKKKFRNAHNFFFFFAKRSRRYFKAPYNRWFLKYQKRIKKTLLEARTFLNSKSKYPMKIRWKKKLKKAYKRKKSLKFMLQKYYAITRDHLNRVKKFIKKKTNRINSLIWFFEGRISTVCVRLHFFWTLKKSLRWIPLGVISLNNLITTSTKTIVRINDFLNVVGPILFFAHRIMRIYGITRYHTKFYKSFNYNMQLPYILSAVILRLPWKFKEMRTKLKRQSVKWVRFKTYFTLPNSFY